MTKKHHISHSGSHLLPLLLTAAIIIALTGSCRRLPSQADNHLIGIDSIIENRPDSALTMLRAIDTTRLNLPESHALYALLLTQAEDKNFIDSNSDTLISRATSFYSTHPGLSPTRRLRAHFYHARILSNAKNYAPSLIHLKEAEEIALKINSHHYLGLIYRNLADIYGEIRIAKEQVRYAQLSLDHFRQSGNERFTTYAYLDLARAYLSANQPETAINTLSGITIITSGQQQPDSSLIAYCHLIKAHANFLQGYYAEAASNYRQAILMDSASLHQIDYRGYIVALIKTGHRDSALNVAAEISQLFGATFITPSQLASAKDDYKTAFHNLQKEYHELDSISWAMMQQNVSDTSNILAQQKIENHKKDIASQKKLTYLILLFTSCVILLIAALCYVYYLRLSQKRQITLLEISDLKNNLFKSSNQNDKFRQQIQQLFISRFRTIDELCTLYYERTDNRLKSTALSKKVISEIESIKNDSEYQTQLEAEINYYNSNLIEDFKRNYPESTPTEIKLFIFSVAGFSNKALCIFLDTKIENLYNLKSRLRKRISAKPIPRQADFLSLI